MTRTPSDDKIECARCGLGNYPTARRCVECGAPLAGRDGEESVDASAAAGRVDREWHPAPNPVLLAGTWFIVGPVALFGVVCALIWLQELLSGRHGVGAADRWLFYLVAPLFWGGLIYFSTKLLYRATKSYVAAKKHAEIDDEDDDGDTDGGEFEDDEFDDEDDEEKE